MNVRVGAPPDQSPFSVLGSEQPVTGVAETGHHANASTFCGRCAEVCPVMIPLPKIMRHWRAVEHAQGLAPKSLTFGLALWAFAAKRPVLAASKVYLNAEFASPNCPDWTVQAIQERGLRVARTAASAWPGPPTVANGSGSPPV